MPLGADDVQAADLGHLAALGLHLVLVLADGPVPDVLGHLEPGRVEDLAVLVLQAFQVGPGHEVGVAAEDDVGASASHVRGDRHGPLPAGLGDDLGLALVVLGVQHLVLDPMMPEHLGDQLGLLDRSRPDQHRPARLVDLTDLVEDRLVLLAVGPVDDVGVAIAGQWPVGGNGDDVERVDLPELVRLGHGRAGHARELLVELEEVLERDRGEGLVLLLDLHPLLGLDRLMQPIRPLPAFHQPAGELVDDHDLVTSDHVLAVATVEVVRLERVVDQVRPLHIAGRVEALDPGDPLGLADAVVVQVAGPLLLLDLEVDVGLEQPRDPVGLGVLPHVVEGRARDDQGRPGLVDQDAVDLVDDRVVQQTLSLQLLGRLHVIAEIIEAELVVRSVGDVAAVDVLPLVRVHLRLDRADGQAEAVIERAHPLGVAARGSR